MTYNARNVRSGLTAIAAVLALSSTPLVAQEVTTPPDPVAETAPDPAPVADPPAPETTAAEPETVESAPTEEASSAPAPARRAVSRTRTAAADPAPSEPARSAAPAQQPADATAEAAPMPPPTAAPVTDPFAPADPVEVDEPAADEALPIAGAAGLGLLALGAIGLAVQGRRRRRDERAHQLANQQYLADHPEEPAAGGREPAFAHNRQPAMAAALPAAAVRTDVPRTRLPEGFDLSRFGPHTQAAYLGPTDDNPSLSLKHRLRRAAAMDQRARQEAGTGRSVPERPAARPRPALEPMWASNGDSFMLRRAGGTAKEQRRPVTQH